MLIYWPCGAYRGRLVIYFAMPVLPWPTLEAVLRRACVADLLTPTRVHRLPAYDTAGAEVWVKREDESGFGISGPKRRKYASLLPALQAAGKEEIALIGGAHSNHVVSLLQLLREAGLRPHLFLKAAHSSTRGGNRLLLELLARPDELHWVSAAHWPQVMDLAAAHLQAYGARAGVIPEGGHHPGAVQGAATLGPDLHRHEVAGGPFDHIFIDAGTGLSASALRGALRLAGHPAALHVVLVAGDPAYFLAQDAQVQTWLGTQLGQVIPAPRALHLHRPASARAFGSVNATVLAELRRLAQDSGLLTDPVYTAKLFLTARHVIQTRHLRGRILLIHSGGGTGLMGFTDRLTPAGDT